MAIAQGDTVILEDGREVVVEQKAQFDSIFSFIYADEREWTDERLVVWNKTEIQFASLDSELNQDYT